MKLSEYIKYLNSLLNVKGDNEVLVAGDNEGNMFMPVSKEFSIIKGKIILYPEHDYIDLE